MTADVSYVTFASSDRNPITYYNFVLLLSTGHRRIITNQSHQNFIGHKLGDILT
jgi:hypothetical protein